MDKIKTRKNLEFIVTIVIAAVSSLPVLLEGVSFFIGKKLSLSFPLKIIFFLLLFIIIFLYYRFKSKNRSTAKKLWKICQNNSLVYLGVVDVPKEGQLVEKILLPELDTPATHLFPVYIARMGKDLEKGPRLYLTSQFWERLNPYPGKDYLSRLESEASNTEIFHLLENFEKATNEKPIIIFDNFNLYQDLYYEGKYTPSEPDSNGNKFWQEIGNLIKDDLIHCMFITTKKPDRRLIPLDPEIPMQDYQIQKGNVLYAHYKLSPPPIPPAKKEPVSSKKFSKKGRRYVKVPMWFIVFISILIILFFLFVSLQIYNYYIESVPKDRPDGEFEPVGKFEKKNERTVK
jgi:hypothetical protein